MMKFPGFSKSADNSKPAKKAPKKSLFRRINDWLHLWLGLISGTVVLIVSVTGCLYVFEKEISDLIKPYKFVTPQEKSYLLPSVMKEKAERYLEGVLPDSVEPNLYGVQYFSRDRSAIIAYNHPEHEYTMIYMDPYDGTVLAEQYLKHDFFRIVLMGHYYLWLPPDIGQPVVAVSILVFVILLITGMVMWWPKNLNKANFDKSFKIKWKASFKRVNYDLHNVLGFYFLTLSLILALTGLVWGFEWFSRSYYWALTGGEKLPEWERVVSDTTRTYNGSANPLDAVWLQMLKEYDGRGGDVGLQFPRDNKGAISFNYNPRPGTYYKRENRNFDQHTLKEIPGNNELYDQKFEEASVGRKIYRMNYDIHVGAVLGLPGKILAFFASLVCASLPVTGFLVWWGKRKKGKKKTTAAQRKSGRTDKQVLNTTLQ